MNADYRISESAWLPANTDSEEDQKLRQFRNRISIITGLTMERAEDIQYSNYGIGGQYEVRSLLSQGPWPPNFKRISFDLIDFSRTTICRLKTTLENSTKKTEIASLPG